MIGWILAISCIIGTILNCKKIKWCFLIWFICNIDCFIMNPPYNNCQSHNGRIGDNITEEIKNKHPLKYIQIQPINSKMKFSMWENDNDKKKNKSKEKDRGINDSRF